MDEKLALPGRRMVGAMMGAFIGLMYGLVANNINALVIRDVPLRFSLSESLADTIGAVVVLAVMGYIVCWPENGVAGVALASVLSALAALLVSLSSIDWQAARIISLIFIQMYTFLPSIVLFVPLSLLLRWSASQFYNNPGKSLLDRHKSRTLLILLGLALVVGSFSLYGEGARAMLRKMDGYVQAVQKDGAGAKVPAVFREVTGVVQQAGRGYVLDWSDNIDRFPIPIVNEDAFTAPHLEMVSVYFDSGDEIVCLFNVTDKSIYLCAKR